MSCLNVVGAVAAILVLSACNAEPDVAVNERTQESTTGDGELEAMPQPGLNLANYLWLKTRSSSYEDAKRAFGSPGVEQSSSDVGGTRTATYVWSVPGSSGQATAIFENDVLISKSQYGLR